MKAFLASVGLFLAFLALGVGVYYLGWREGLHAGLSPEVTSCGFPGCLECEETP